jgi:predicted metallo-beta-lactamase superfamily hydrolase
MTVEIVGAESLGVRSLCCTVQAGTRRIVIDPGVALGYVRHGLLPHPCELALAARIRKRIVAALGEATDVVFSHMHGDHVPLRLARAYQLSLQHLPQAFSGLSCWSKGPAGLSQRMQRRFADLAERLGTRLCVAEGMQTGPVSFSPAFPHGDPSKGLGSVMMTRVELGSAVFVHASDIQLLEMAAIDQILAWQPQIVLVAGPPLYLRDRGALTQQQDRQAWNNALRLAQQIETLIIDHHLLRSREGFDWLDSLSHHSGRRVCCAADFMGRARLPLEALRVKFYRAMPVPAGWYEAYAQGRAEPEEYFDEGLLAAVSNQEITQPGSCYAPGPGVNVRLSLSKGGGFEKPERADERM